MLRPCVTKNKQIGDSDEDEEDSDSDTAQLVL
jgi:hypothetical protein